MSDTELAIKIFIVILNVVVFNTATIMLRMSNFNKLVKVLLMVLGNAVIIGGSVYIMMISGV